MMRASLCSLRGVSVTYTHGWQKTSALRNIDLDIARGERLAIIGESGSGKSTLARVMAGLLPAETETTGMIRWSGFEGSPRAGRDIGFVFQDPASSLNPVLTVGEQIADGARRHLGLTWKQAYAHAETLMARVRLPDPTGMLRAFPYQLSGGQRQRVVIAAAIAARPRLLIADEPTSALDMVVQAEIMRLLDELVQQDGMTLVFITHDIALASGFVDTLAIFRNGQLVETGPVHSVIDRPSTDYARMLITSHIDINTPPLIAEKQG